MSEVKIQPVESVAYINPDSLDCSWPHHQAIYIDISSVGEGIIIEQPEPVDTISLPSRAKRLIKVGDTVISTVRPNRRSIFYAKNPEPNWVVSTGFAVIRPDTTKIDPLYLYYNVFSKSFTDQLTAVEKGAAYPAVLPSDVGAALISLHPLPEQRRIAHILGTLDDKIENNRKTAKTLEAMAQAIFQSWFVNFDPVRAKMAGESRESICKRLKLTPEILNLFPDRLVDSELGEIPEGWEIGVLNDYIKSCLGGDWGSDCISSENNVAVRCVRGADIAALYTCSMAKMPIRYIKHSSYEKREIHAGDIVLEISGGSPTQSTGRSILITEELIHRSDLPLVTSNFCRSIQFRSIQQSLYASYILKHLYAKDEFLQYENGSTGIKNFAFTLFCSEHLMVLPTSAILAFFETIVRNLQKRPAAIRAESDTIENIRDTLLPKLLSGEIRIPEAKFLIEEATG